MNTLIIKHVESQVRQRIFGGVTLAVCALMIANALGLVRAATEMNANTTFNITSGDFTLSNGPTQVRFGSQSFGYSGQVQSSDEADNIVVTDYRGTSAAWSVAVNANSLTDGAKTITADKIRLYQDFRGVLTNIENATTSKVTLGANGTLDSSGVTLMNTSSSAGIIQFDNGFFNLTLAGTELAGTYAGKIFLTLT